MGESEWKRLRLVLDADIHVRAARALRLRGFDVVSAWETGQQGVTDEAQLRWAAEQGRCLVTFNVAHFSLLHVKWLAEARHHAGIALCDQIPVRDFLRRCYVLLNHFTSAMLADQLLWLPKA